MSYIKTTIRVQPVDTVVCEILIAGLTELGDASLLKTKSSYNNIILANINKNILMDDMPHYNRALKNNGHVLLSGFYKEDFEKIDTNNPFAEVGTSFDKRTEQLGGCIV